MSETVPLKEFRRKERVLDMMITGQSFLRDRYRTRAFTLRIIILTLSIVATLLALASTSLSVSAAGFRITLQQFLGLLTGLVFLATLIDMLADPSVRAGAYGEGARRLAELKNLFRSVTVEGESAVMPDGFTAEYERVVAIVPPIPERQFLRVKTRHTRKVAVSRLLDSYPGAPLAYLYIVATIHGIIGSHRTRTGADGERTGDIG